MSQSLDYKNPTDFQEAKMALKLAVDALCRIHNADDAAEAKQIAADAIEKLSPSRMMAPCADPGDTVADWNENE